jgi:alpha-glucosidase
VPNHTSDQHDWFKKSAANETGYENYYIWRDCPLENDGTRRYPNNWVSNTVDSRNSPILSAKMSRD